MCGTGRSFVFAVLARDCACASCTPARLYVRRRAKHGAERRSRLTLEPFMRRDTSGFIVRANISEIMYTQKVVRCCAPPVLSREAARECSARRKPWWRAENGRAPEGRKNSCDTDLEGTHLPKRAPPIRRGLVLRSTAEGTKRRSTMLAACYLRKPVLAAGLKYTRWNERQPFDPFPRRTLRPDPQLGRAPADRMGFHA